MTLREISNSRGEEHSVHFVSAFSLKGEGSKMQNTGREVRWCRSDIQSGLITGQPQRHNWQNPSDQGWTGTRDVVKNMSQGKHANVRMHKKRHTDQSQ